MGAKVKQATIEYRDRKKRRATLRDEYRRLQRDVVKLRAGGGAAVELERVTGRLREIAAELLDGQAQYQAAQLRARVLTSSAPPTSLVEGDK